MSSLHVSYFFFVFYLSFLFYSCTELHCVNKCEWINWTELNFKPWLSTRVSMNERLVTRVHDEVACVAGVRRGGKRERWARKAREDRGSYRGPSPSRAHFDFPSFLRPATQANDEVATQCTVDAKLTLQEYFYLLLFCTFFFSVTLHCINFVSVFPHPLLTFLMVRPSASMAQASKPCQLLLQHTSDNFVTNRPEIGQKSHRG